MVRQTGHAILHLDNYDEDYLIPFPDFRVKGFFSGKLYPELHGVYHIISSSGFTSEISFSGKGFLSGVKNSFEAKLYRYNDDTKSSLYTAQGQWSDEFSIWEPGEKTPMETFSQASLPKLNLLSPT